MPENKTIPLLDLCNRVKRGASSFYLKEGDEKIKILRHTCIRETGTIDFSAVEEIKIKKSARTADNLLKAGDVLIALRGSAKVAVVPPEAEGFTFSADFVALELDTTRIAPELVATYLTLPHVVKYLENKNQGRVIRSVSAEAILTLEIATPDAQTQNQLSELLSLIAEQNALLAKESERLADLKNAACSAYLGGA